MWKHDLKMPMMQLVYSILRWRVVNKELPNLKTPYSGKYGVQVLAFDLHEYINSGSCQPFNASFIFKEKQFKCIFYPGGKMLPVEVTHWVPLPPIPIIEIEKKASGWKRGKKKAASNNRKILQEEIKKMGPEIDVSSPHGFRYFKGSDKLAKEFISI
jgi:hypothetical protein